MKTIVITGASSGIGKATAKHFAKQGWKVAATMRTPETETELSELEHVTLHTLDVTDEDSVARASAQILAQHERVDVVLNNAGYGLLGPFEAASTADIQRQFETNVFGLMRVTRAFLPHFRAKQSGMFINVSSVGGLVTFPLMSVYHSSKWAVEGFSESVSHELGQLGIRVKLIEPGGVATDFGRRSMAYARQEGLTAYDPAQAKQRENFGQLGIELSTAELIAEGIYEAATDGKAQLRYVIGPDAERLCAARREQGAEAFIADMNARVFGGS